MRGSINLMACQTHLHASNAYASRWALWKMLNSLHAYVGRWAPHEKHHEKHEKAPMRNTMKHNMNSTRKNGRKKTSGNCCSLQRFERIRPQLHFQSVIISRHRYTIQTDSIHFVNASSARRRCVQVPKGCCIICPSIIPS